MPANVLIDNVSSEWIAGAVQLVLETDLAGSRTLIPVLVSDDSSAYLNRAQEVLRATVSEHASRLTVTAAVTDNFTQKEQKQFDLEGSGSSGILPLLNELAKRIDKTATRFSTNDDRALQAFVKASSPSIDAQGRIAALTQAISIDPSFGLAYVTLAEADAQAAPQLLGTLLQAGSAHQSTFTALDRARFEALVNRYAHAPLSRQEAALRKVLQIDPNQLDALAAVGSLSFLRGDAVDGQRSLGRALELSPANVSVRRALADGLLETRHYAEAQKLLEPMDNDISVLPELAICALLEGNATRANGFAERLFAAISNPDVKVLFRAVWLKLSGKSAEANQLVTSARFAQPAAASIAFSELSVWQMMGDDFASARQSAAKARELSPNPTSFAGIVTVLASANGSADTWKQQVNASFLSSNEQLKQMILGYGLFLGGHYAEATDVWDKIVQQTGGADLRARAMFAAALIRQGKADQAQRINVEPFVPEFGDLYASVSFFELNRDLRVIVR